MCVVIRNSIENPAPLFGLCSSSNYKDIEYDACPFNHRVGAATAAVTVAIVVVYLRYKPLLLQLLSVPFLIYTHNSQWFWHFLSEYSTL